MYPLKNSSSNKVIDRVKSRQNRTIFTIGAVFLVVQLVQMIFVVKMATDQNIKMYSTDSLRYIDGLSESQKMAEEKLFHAADDFNHIVQKMYDDFDVKEVEIVKKPDLKGLFSYKIGDVRVIWNGLSHVDTYLPVKSKRYETGYSYFVKIVAPVKLSKELLPFIAFTFIIVISALIAVNNQTRTFNREIVDPLNELAVALKRGEKLDSQIELEELETLRNAANLYIDNKIYAETGKFISGIHHCLLEALHDFNAYVGKIGSFKDIYQFNAYKNQVDVSIASATMIVESLRDINFEPGDNFEPASLKQTILGAFQYAQKSIKRKEKVKIICDVDSINKVKIPHSSLFRILVNLIKNALQEDITYVEIGAKNSTDGKVLLSITNDGLKKRIKNEDLFKEYFTKKAGGTGLGLPIIKKILENFKATLNIFQQGQTFRAEVTVNASDEKDNVKLILPQYTTELFSYKDEEDAKIIKFVDEAKKRSKPYKILVVDDKIEAFIALQNMLKATGLDAYIIADYAANFAGHEYDLFLVDLNIYGQIAGFDICESIKRKFDNSVVCIHSNYLDKDFNERAMASNADYSLPKPISVNQMIHILERTSS